MQIIDQFKNMKNTLSYIYWIMALVYVFCIFTFSSFVSSLFCPHRLTRILEGIDSEFLLSLAYLIFPFLDKIKHIAVYFGLGILLYLALSASKNLAIKRYTIPLTFVSGFFLGVIDEIHQLFVPERSFSIFDMAADGIGIILALAVIFVVSKIRNRSISSND